MRARSVKFSWYLLHYKDIPIANQNIPHISLVRLEKTETEKPFIINTKKKIYIWNSLVKRKSLIIRRWGRSEEEDNHNPQNDMKEGEKKDGGEWEK